MKKELEKTYNPADIEDRLYAKWVNKKYFHAEVNANKKPYTIVIPPPNITGQLHMGHALDNTLQDIIIRSKRMQGYETLWMPGTDHASIATEAKIVEAMKEEGLTKDDIGREKFLERAWAWKDKFGGRIVSQLKKMGSSCDWDRERFTMDEGCNKAVKEVFVNLYNKGLIYRGERIINWCPHCLTSISDAEVEYEDQKGHFWHLRYAFADGSGYINLATTRPETLLGDTAVAVNPNDERYKDLVGKKLILPLVHREIPLIADDYVDMEFGTGVVKITPAHDPNDFEVGLRHDLPIINVMTDDAKIVDEYEKYAGMDRYEARKAIVEDLEKEGALVKIEDHDHNVGTCYRCGTTVEPRVSKQWFVKMKPLAGPAIDAVKEGKTKFVPEHFNKTYFHWLENIRDWCISRQLWWGHQIPAFYCDDCGELVVTKENSAVCPKCGKPMRQDPDTLDTWFSSALWPFSTLGWPDKTEEMDYFYPTNTLVTGYDIIPFWVMRMMFSGLEHTGQVPFDTVLIHGLVRDSQGRKMSKSLGNGIDPLEVIDKYGADALRLTLVTGNAPGNDMRFYWERVEASRNFANKVWNASRFIMMNFDQNEDVDYENVTADELTQADKWILSKVNTLAKDVTVLMDSFDLGIAVQKIYQMQVDRSKSPILVGVSERDYSGAVSLPEENKEHKAAVFENVVYGAIHKKLLSTLYMAGEGFEGGWADSLFRKLCVGRRLFKGRNLYVSGACLMAREMAEEKRLGDYLLLDEQMVTSQVAVNLYAEAKQQKVVLVEAGVPWYLVDEELELIPSGETELALQTKNVLTQKEKQFMIELDPLTGRLDRRCRLMLRIRFESPSQCIVTIKDEGFGELFPTSNRIWEKQVEL